MIFLIINLNIESFKLYYLIITIFKLHYVLINNSNHLVWIHTWSRSQLF